MMFDVVGGRAEVEGCILSNGWTSVRGVREWALTGQVLVKHSGSEDDLVVEIVGLVDRGLLSYDRRELPAPMYRKQYGCSALRCQPEGAHGRSDSK